MYCITCAKSIAQATIVANLRASVPPRLKKSSCLRVFVFKRSLCLRAFVFYNNRVKKNIPHSLFSLLFVYLQVLFRGSTIKIFHTMINLEYYSI